MEPVGSRLTLKSLFIAAVTKTDGPGLLRFVLGNRPVVRFLDVHNRVRAGSDSVTCMPAGQQSPRR